MPQCFLSSRCEALMVPVLNCFIFATVPSLVQCPWYSCTEKSAAVFLYQFHTRLKMKVHQRRNFRILDWARESSGAYMCLQFIATYRRLSSSHSSPSVLLSLHQRIRIDWSRCHTSGGR
ncbi:hypothetical protein GYMLUDRAFT_671766 [Collybiopsis luxurians FD-317 M1]|uniref:Unplaced genomic scaffold GYMLUscaffold_31, whole genome shotgun sequence n=1 Tax=Collybiopsis luxurians FD-317 M1 TaxID=944289 RepID=A0A0D0BVL9_9AGAR|nr:hypothetical protein GYMLUDRAFT_671766 [Collybiopsis luxurians FD-317 M1]